MTPRSIRADRPIDPITIDILRAVAEEAQAQQIDCMLVGATARDILLTHVFGMDTRRATYDVDFAVAVKDWDHFNSLRTALIARGTFQAGTQQQHLNYQTQYSDWPYHLDLVPFGGVSQGTNEVAWPPDMKIIMNVAGYDDVLAAAELVRFASDFVGNVSLPGLAILKLVAWSDRGRTNPKDAQDLIGLMDSYTAAGNFDRVYDEESIIAAADYDPDLAGVYLLGKDIRRVASAGTIDVLNDIIDRDYDRLKREMARTMRYREDADNYVDQRLRLLQQALA